MTIYSEFLDILKKQSQMLSTIELISYANGYIDALFYNDLITESDYVDMSELINAIETIIYSLED
jgi:hypothetical protein